RPGLCQGCALCSGLCKHLVMVDGKPVLDDYCITDKNGLACGKCYSSCPQANRKPVTKEAPLAIYALQSTDENIRKNAISGGFVTTLNKHLLDTEQITHLVEVKAHNDRPQAIITQDPEETSKYSGLSYGRSGVLAKVVDVLGQEHGQIGLVGVPCEIQGALDLETNNKADLFKIGLFCVANIGSDVDDEGVVFSPCRRACPAGVNASGYVNLIREGKYEEAVDLVREENPLPSICGRICTHECEYNCTLIGTNHPIAVRELKKFITEWERQNIKGKKQYFPKPKPDGKKVAIIGAGPSGLTAGFYLVKMGYQPTIFEKSNIAGGMLRFGVPKFRLPDDVLDYDIEFVTRAGVEIKYNTALGPDLTVEDLKSQGYESVFLSTGQYKPRSFKLEGEELPNVHYAIDFLLKRKYRHYENTEEFKGKTVGIMGGGPVAVDVAQTALRLGAERVIAADVQTAEMLKMVLHEIPENEKEFIEYKFNTSTSKFTKENGKLTFNSYRVEWMEKDGRKTFEKVDGSEYTFDVDSVVIAVGQTVDFELIDAATDHKLEKVRGKIKIDEVTMETNIPGLFAGGDIIMRGKNVAVAAIAHGREAAKSIDRYLRGVDLRKNRHKRDQMYFNGPLNAPKDVSKKPQIEITSENLWMNFSEIDGIFNEEMAVMEAQRCFNCNSYCSHCQDFAGIYADLTAGEIGSDKNYTTVVVWTERAKEIVKDMIQKGLVIEGAVNKDAIDLAIDKKMKRGLIEFAKTPREKIYNTIQINGPSTISQMSKDLGLPAKDVRYDALRLVQKQKFSMEIDEELREPVFSLFVEE
ncbi:MAG: FAD-dependent oxidoreductase, partial [Promethearchaeota archaeon]